MSLTVNRIDINEWFFNIELHLDKICDLL
jgi:hypothetical protein